MKNYFHLIDDYFERKKPKFKKFARIDFFDCCNLFLFILGMVLILIVGFSYKITFVELLTPVILWFTGIAILQYTKETYWLKQLEQKNLKFQKAPFVIVYYESESFVFKNVGKGVARNVKWRIKIPKEEVMARVLGDVLKILHSGLKTIIGAGEYTKVNISPDAKSRLDAFYFEPTEYSQTNYEIEIYYENIDGIKYFTKLKSGAKNDGYKVLDYKEIK